MPDALRPHTHVRCRHCLRGFCLYSGGRGQEYEEAIQCRHIHGFMRDWDAFLDRAEAFGLGEDLAEEIWERLAEKKLAEPASCPGCGDAPLLGRVSDFVDCPNLAEGVCLLALPRCTGACPFTAEKK